MRREKFFKNLGLINLIGKSFGRLFFLGLQVYLALKLSTGDFAQFAIYWSTLRMMTYYAGNNYYITFFDRVRFSILREKILPLQATVNIFFTFLLFLIIFIPISITIFHSLKEAFVLLISTSFYLVIRYISEYSKINNNILLSIFIEDTLFYVTFFTFCITFLLLNNSLDIWDIQLLLCLTLFITMIIGVLLFKKKFSLKTPIKIGDISKFSLKDFKEGLNYSFLKGGDVLNSFLIRYLGEIFFGSMFVAYTHILFQFYNIFNIITMSVISGFQSKIVLSNNQKLNFYNFKHYYKLIVKSLWPFSFLLSAVLILFRDQITGFLFPNYIQYSNLLVWVGLIGILLSIIQPYLYILIYNNNFSNIKKAIWTQYLTLILILALPLLGLQQNIWLFIMMTAFIIIQGIFGILQFKKMK